MKTISSERIIQITKDAVKSSFFSFFLCREEVKTRHLLLYKLFPDESNIRSVMGGIETSLGVTLWEKIATKIAEENGYEILDHKNKFLQPINMPITVTNLIAKYKDMREVEDANLPMENYINELNKTINNLELNDLPASFKKLTKGSGVDIYIKKNNQEYAFDIKTVQINAGSGTKFNETLMKWIAFNYLHQKHNKTNIPFRAHLVIPYDPHTESNWWTEFGERAYPLDHVDLLLGNEFWDLISDQKDTLTYITKAFYELVDEGFHKSYLKFFHEPKIQDNIELIEKYLKVKYLGIHSPNSYIEKLDWECMQCSTKLKASLKMFTKPRICKSCKVAF